MPIVVRVPGGHSVQFPPRCRHATATARSWHPRPADPQGWGAAPRSSMPNPLATVRGTLEQLAMAFVAERASAWIRSHAEVEPDDRQQGREHPDTDLRRHAELDLAHSPARHSGCPRDIRLPQAQGPAGLSEFPAHRHRGSPGFACASIAMTFPQWHEATGWRPPRIGRLPGPVVPTMSRWAARRRIRSWLTCAGATCERDGDDERLHGGPFRGG